jgi:lipopolysaccharide assembly protein A
VTEGRSRSGQPDDGRPAPPPAAVPSKVERTRMSMLWTAVAVGLLVLAAILIFIAQNSTSVRVHFLSVARRRPTAH